MPSAAEVTKALFDAIPDETKITTEQRERMDDRLSEIAYKEGHNDGHDHAVANILPQLRTLLDYFGVPYPGKDADVYNLLKALIEELEVAG